MKKKILNKRRINFFNTKIILSIILFLIILIVFFNLFLNNQKILNKFTLLIENYSTKYDYTLSKVIINGANFIREDELLDLINLHKDKSIFLIPVQNISKKISQNNWVKSVSIKSNYKDTIAVNIKEAIPSGIYYNGTNNLLFSNDLDILEIIINDENKFSKLIKFKGADSMLQSKNLLNLLSDNFKQSVLIANFINKRRWNLELKNNILLKLPEKNINNALKNYNKIYMNFSNIELNNIESIDLRLSKKAILKYRENNSD